MSELVGKTIARVEDYGDTLYFTDGTALEVTSDDGHWVNVLGWAEVQKRFHETQGCRERDRMRRLEALLHPRDREWLVEQRRIARARADREWEATATPDQIIMRDVMRYGERLMIEDFNRAPFLLSSSGTTINIPKVSEKRKARRS